MVQFVEHLQKDKTGQKESRGTFIVFVIKKKIKNDEVILQGLLENIRKIIKV